MTTGILCRQFDLRRSRLFDAVVSVATIFEIRQQIFIAVLLQVSVREIKRQWIR